MKSIDKHKNDGKNIWAYCSIENVQKNIKNEINNNKIKLIKGPVEKTLLDNNNLPQFIYESLYDLNTFTAINKNNIKTTK